MKKFLIFSMLFVCGITSFAFTPTPPTVSSPDWTIILNDKGVYLKDDGKSCITVLYNIGGEYGNFSNCP